MIFYVLYFYFLSRNKSLLVIFLILNCFHEISFMHFIDFKIKKKLSSCMHVQLMSFDDLIFYAKSLKTKILISYIYISWNPHKSFFHSFILPKESIKHKKNILIKIIMKIGIELIASFSNTNYLMKDITIIYVKTSLTRSELVYSLYFRFFKNALDN